MKERKENELSEYTDEQLLGMVIEAKKIPVQKSGKKATEAFSEYYQVDFTYSKATHVLGKRGYEQAWVRKNDVGEHRTNAQKIDAALEKAKNIFFDEEELNRISLYITEEDRAVWTFLINKFGKQKRKYGQAALMHTFLESFSKLLSEEEHRQGKKIVKKNNAEAKKRFEKRNHE